MKPPPPQHLGRRLRALSRATLFACLLLMPLIVGCETAMDDAPELSAPAAFAALQEGQLTLIDIRTPPEWRQTGVAPGARLLDMNHPGGKQGFIEALLREVDGHHDAPIGLICRTGNRTTLVQRVLLHEGFTQVYNIREGMAGSSAGPGWLARRLPVISCQQC